MTLKRLQSHIDASLNFICIVFSLFLYKVGCKIDVIYVIERCYYTRNDISDINGFFADLTEGLKNDTSGVDLKVAFVIYDSDIDYEEALTNNLTKVKEELENIPKSPSTS